MAKKYQPDSCRFGIDNKQDQTCSRKGIGTAYWPDHTYPNRVCWQHGKLAAQGGYIVEWDADRAKP